MPLSPFLKDVTERVYQAPFPNCADAEQTPFLGRSFHPLVRAWLESGEDPALADLIRSARNSGLPLEQIPLLIRHLANLFFLASAGRQKLDETLRGNHLLSFAGYMPLPDYDQEHRRQSRAFIHEEEPNRVVQCLTSHFLPPDADLAVEIGAGSGRDVVALVRHGVKRVIGLDPSPAAVKRARQRVKERLNGLCGRAEIREETLEGFAAANLSLSKQVDAITATSVFHLSPPGQLPTLLGLLCRLLKPNGLVALQQKTSRSPFNGHGHSRPQGSVCLERAEGYTSRLCADGHPRYFIEPDAFELALQRGGLKAVFSETEMLDYDTVGDPHEFNLVIAKPN